jgi:hypothetical protein
MKLRDYLAMVGATFDTREPMSAPAQLLLRAADEHLDEHIPSGVNIKGSGGQGIPTATPWVVFFDPDETTTAQEGFYLVYLFAAGLETVSLSLNQGVTRLRDELGHGDAVRELRRRAELQRQRVPAAMRGGP